MVAEDGTVIAGNGTLRAASRLGWTHLAVVRYRGSAESAKRFALQDNRTAELAAWDAEALTEMLAELSGLDLESFGAAWTPDELVALVGDMGVLEVLPEAPPELPGGGSGSAPDELPQPPAAAVGGSVRLVQLYLSEVQFEQFTREVRTLGERWGLVTVSETVARAVSELVGRSE